MLNLFAFRSTDPRDMKTQPCPIGPKNDEYTISTCSTAGIIVACWGNHGSFEDRSEAIKQLLLGSGLPVHCLKLTKAGEPSHPLYLKKDLQPKLWIGDVT